MRATLPVRPRRSLTALQFQGRHSDRPVFPGNAPREHLGTCQAAAFFECCAYGGRDVDDGEDGLLDDSVLVGYKDRALKS